MTTVSNEPIVNLPFLYLNGMVASMTSNTVLSITGGQCRDATNVYDISVLSTASLNAATTGLNGLDTGSLAASKVYNIFAIMDVTANPANPAGYVLSLSAIPLMPFGYGAYRLVGYWVTDASSHFLLGYYTGQNSNKTFVYDAAQATSVTAGASTTYAAIDLSAVVPAVANTPVSLLINFIPNAAGDTVKLQPVNATGDAVVITGQVTTVHVTAQSTVVAQIATGKPEVNYKVSSGSDAVAISVLGFSVSL